MRFGSREWIWAALAAALAAASPVYAQADPQLGLQPTLTASFRDWFVYIAGAGDERICYALSQPKQSEPTDVQRDPIFFMVANWQNGDTRDEPSIMPGYPYREGGAVQIEIGSDTFELFTRNEGTDGGAWVQDLEDERRLIDAMKRGTTMMVTGTSTRGTLTRDHFSLLGITAALERVSNLCS